MPVQRFRLCFRRLACTLLLLIMLSSPTPADDSPQVPTWRLRLNVGQSLEQRGELDAAEREMGLALSAAGRVPESDLPLAKVLDALGDFYDDVGRFADAERCWTGSLALWRRILGPQHIALSRVVNRLAALYLETHQRAKAERLDLEGWAQRVEQTEPSGVDERQILNSLEELYALQGNISKAEATGVRALHLTLDSDGSETAESAIALNNLGLMCFEAHHYQAAVDYLSRAVRTSDRFGGPQDLVAAATRHTLAEAYEALGHYAEAGPLFSRALSLAEHCFGPNSVRTAAILKSYAHFLRTQGQNHEAKKLEARVRTIVQQAERAGASRGVVDIRELSLR